MTHGIYCVIVTYNPMKWVDKLYSFLKAEKIVSNTIFIDNGSTDEFPQWIEQNKLSDSVYFQNKNLGFGAANNLGIKLALKKNAKYVLLLNQDAWIEEGSLDILIEVISRNKNIGIVSPLHFNKLLTKLDNNFSHYLGSSNLVSYFEHFPRIKYPFIESDFVNAAIWLLSVHAIEKVGGFNPSFYHYGEDDEYCGRLKKRGFKIAIVPNAIGVHDRENRDILFSKQREKLNCLNSGRIIFFNTARKFPFAVACTKVLLNKCKFRLNFFDRILIVFRLFLEKNAMVSDKKVILNNVSPFLNT
jgi:N-acetylglucosaminyl-diphospho-decaprenol L-rhamnosyltransferase